MHTNTCGISHCHMVERSPVRQQCSLSWKTSVHASKAAVSALQAAKLCWDCSIIPRLACAPLLTWGRSWAGMLPAAPRLAAVWVCPSGSAPRCLWSCLQQHGQSPLQAEHTHTHTLFVLDATHNSITCLGYLPPHWLLLCAKNNAPTMVSHDGPSESMMRQSPVNAPCPRSLNCPSVCWSPCVVKVTVSNVSAVHSGRTFCSNSCTCWACRRASLLPLLPTLMHVTAASATSAVCASLLLIRLCLWGGTMHTAGCGLLPRQTPMVDGGWLNIVVPEISSD